MATTRSQGIATIEPAEGGGFLLAMMVTAFIASLRYHRPTRKG
jgi:hypothetical protein